jgi:aminopeptidase N
MENPGAILLSDNYIFMDKTSIDKRTKRAITVLHELSHMWFGDFVTMYILSKITNKKLYKKEMVG